MVEVDPGVCWKGDAIVGLEVLCAGDVNSTLLLLWGAQTWQLVFFSFLSLFFGLFVSCA